MPSTYRTARKKLREEYQPQINELNMKALNLKQEIGDLKIAVVETGVDVGPAIYLARVFNTEIDTVVKFFIFILVFVFDPLAVSLVIAANMAFAQIKGLKPKEKLKDYKVYKKSEAPKEKIITKEVPVEKIIYKNDPRMNHPRIQDAIKHARRAGEWEDWYMYIWIYK